MAIVLNGTNQYGLVSLLDETSGQDLSFFCWVKSSQTLTSATIFGLHGAGAGFKMVAMRRNASDFVDGRYRPSTIEVLATSTEKVVSTYKKALIIWDESAGSMTVQVEGETPVTVSGSPNDLNIGGLAVGCQFGSSSYGTPGGFLGGSIAHAALWRGTALTGADVTGLMNGTLKPNEASVAPTHYKPFVNDQTGGIGTDYTLFNSPTINAEDPYAVAAGPTITGPDTTTEGAVTVQTGTLLDTVTTQSLISGSYSIAQTIDSATAGTLNYIAESGVNQCTPSTPVSGVPLAATISAAGVTPYVVQQKADDGVNPPATRNITLSPEATHEVIQTMIAVANTNPEQSVFGSTWVTVEDNQQARLPKVVDGVTFTWNDKGEFTTDFDKTVTFQYELFSPASGNWSAIDLTVRGTVIIDSGEKKRKNKRQSQVYQYYLNKNWKEKFQGSE